MSSDSESKLVLEPVTQVAGSNVQRGGFLRLAIAVLLISLSVSLPDIGILVIPFAVALLSLDLMRGRSRSALLIVGALTVILTTFLLVNAGIDTGWVVIAGVASIGFVWLSNEQKNAARSDTQVDTAWPEPVVSSGVTRVLLSWSLLAAIICAAIAVYVGVEGIQSAGNIFIKEGYTDILKSCEPGGDLAKQTALCESIDQQKEMLVDFIKNYPLSVLTVLSALIAFSCSITAHLVTTMRARVLNTQGISIPVRPKYKIKDIEMHWLFAYIAIIGIVFLMASGQLPTSISDVTFAIGVGFGTLGALVFITHGFGALAYFLTRKPMPTWYKILLVFMFIFAMPMVLATCAFAGIIDMWLGLRRRNVSA